jgi:hypothetical protein
MLKLVWVLYFRTLEISNYPLFISRDIGDTRYLNHTLNTAPVLSAGLSTRRASPVRLVSNLPNMHVRFNQLNCNAAGGQQIASKVPPQWVSALIPGEALGFGESSLELAPFAA